MSKVTVIVPIYNHEKYLRRCLDGICAQKTNFDFKAFLFDDASTDHSAAIVKEYVEKYPHILVDVIRPKNLGVVENVHDAYSYIEGDYFCVLEGDDYWTDTHKLQQQVELLDSNLDVDLCGHQTSICNVSTNQEELYRTDIIGDVLKLEGEKNIIRPHTCSRMYRNKYNLLDAPNKAGVVFDTAIFWFYMLQNPKLLYINKPMATYNVHDSGMFSGASRKKRKYMSLVSIQALNEATDYKFDVYCYQRFITTLQKKYKIFFWFYHKMNYKKSYQKFVDLYK